MTVTEDGKARGPTPGTLPQPAVRHGGLSIELAWRLQSLGYEIEQGKNGAPEIRGYTKEYLEASSPRSQQIREHMAEQG